MNKKILSIILIAIFVIANINTTAAGTITVGGRSNYVHEFTVTDGYTGWNEYKKTGGKDKSINVDDSHKFAPLTIHHNAKWINTYPEDITVHINVYDGSDIKVYEDNRFQWGTTHYKSWLEVDYSGHTYKVNTKEFDI